MYGLTRKIPKILMKMYTTVAHYTLLHLNSVLFAEINHKWIKLVDCKRNDAIGDCILKIWHDQCIIDKLLRGRQMTRRDCILLSFNSSLRVSINRLISRLLFGYRKKALCDGCFNDAKL